MRLIDSESEEFKNALLDAYPSSSQLAQMLYFRLKKSLSAIIEGKSLEETIFQLIVTAEAQGWIEQLVIAAHKYNPGNELLKRFYQSYRLKHGITTAFSTPKNISQETLQLPKSESVEGKRKPSKTKTTNSANRSERYDSVSAGPDNFVTQVNKHLKKAQQCMRKGAALFQAMGEYGFTTAQYKEGVELPKHLREHLDNLYELVDTTSPFPEIATVNHKQNISKQHLISKIDLIAEQLEDELAPSLDDKDLPCEDIREKFENLEQMLGELYPLFLTGSLPTQVRVMKLSNPPVRNADKSVHKNNRARSSSNRFSEVPYTSPLTSDLRNQLIDALLALPVTSSFAGRSAFLNGIPDSLNRNPANARLDFDMLISQLERLGQLSSGHWPLLLLIDDALPYAQGFQHPEETLKMVRQVLAEAYKIK